MTRTATAPRAPAQRSAVTNDPARLLGVNGCTALARLYRDLVEGLAAELGGDLSADERNEVRIVAGHQLKAEKLMAREAMGEDVDPEEYTRALNAATRARAALLRRQKGRKARKPERIGVHKYLAEREATP